MAEAAFSRSRPGGKNSGNPSEREFLETDTTAKHVVTAEVKRRSKPTLDENKTLITTQSERDTDREIEALVALLIIMSIVAFFIVLILIYSVIPYFKWIGFKSVGHSTVAVHSISFCVKMNDT